MSTRAERWYQEAVLYNLEVDTFQDSDGDGVGDLAGLIGRLDYLARLGVTCLWLNPVHPSPLRDDGYDVTDYYGVHPRLGSLGDFAELIHQAGNRGVRVMIDLVVNHTSDQHPWFQEARSSRESRYRDWYIWSDTKPAHADEGIVFPGEQRSVWSYDEHAGAWYYHRFYDFEPDLNLANPAVRDEIEKVMGFWLQLGVSGFRMDAAPFVIEMTRPGDPNPPLDFGLLTGFRELLQWRRGDAVVLAEANVDPDALPAYVGDEGGSSNRLHLLFDFLLNGSLMLALATAEAAPIVATLRDTPRLPRFAQWTTFLRNHDEDDLSRLGDRDRERVFAVFAPDPKMRLYDRGIRRRLASMLGGDRGWLELAYSLQFTLRGTPILRYGEEIGMGEDLSLRGRDAIRTPMQWDGSRSAGFSPAPPDRLVRPVIAGGPFGCETVNVAAQRHDPGSLLAWFERMVHTLRECPEVSSGECSVVDAHLPPAVLAHRFESEAGEMLFLHNLGTEEVRADLGPQPGASDVVFEVFADRQYEQPDAELRGLTLGPRGYRWLRLRRGPR